MRRCFVSSWSSQKAANVTARELPAKATPVSPAEVYLALRLQLEAQLGREQTTRAGTMILLGQMALETGRFKASMNYNLGGVKCGPTWQGCWQHFTTTEHFAPADARKYMAEAPPGSSVEYIGADADGKWILKFSGKHPMNRFRAFESLDDAVAAHVRFLLGARYRQAVMLAMAARPDDYARALRIAGYYTGDANDYAKNVRQLAREYDHTLPEDPAPPTQPKDAPAQPDALAVAAAVKTPVVAPPEPIAPPEPVLPPPVVAVTLPRVGEKKEEEPRPWWVRLVVWLTRGLIRLLVRRRLP